MKWYSGNIAEAVNLAKSKEAIFVVYIEGAEEESKKLTGFIDNVSVSQKLESDDFVAIKLKSPSVEYQQFVQIYQLVPVPSIFFIGKNGVPIEIGTSAIKTPEELLDKVTNVLDKFREDNPSTAASSSSQPRIFQETPKPKELEVKADTSTTTSEVKQSDENFQVVCENGVCYKKPLDKTENKPVESSSTAEKTSDDTEEKVKRAMQLIEQKKKEKADEEARLEKEREIRRRKEGQDLQNLKKWQEDQEMKQVMEDRMKAKRDEKAARERVLAQIAQDKAERAAKFGPIPVEPKIDNTTKVSPVSTPTSNSDTARIQFKKPDGESETHSFSSSDLFSNLYAFVKNTVLVNTSVREFSLATTFPRREFKEDDYSKTLLELGLTPNSVLLIIPLKKSAGPSNLIPTQTSGLTAMLTSLVMGLFSPVVALFNYLKNIIGGGNRGGNADNHAEAGKRKRNEDVLSDNDAAKKRNLRFYAGDSGQGPSGSGASSQTAKKRNTNSNIHRLHDHSDSEDENNTYNGNSTQQM